ncbi:linear amide C-N hydrolase [Microbulbifer hainanensis]|uniref:linear amide C-N hydrolase n=1 Tax=Microbulbifer hainanensis TaxID=2735675 RepID=UPI001865CD4A|nr:choloylglycine hydrolase family protein [Microbulbifer hainanensis]
MTRFNSSLLLLSFILLVPLPSVQACTYVRLVGADGSSHPSRTMEWGVFEFNHLAFTATPRGVEMKSMPMPDGKAGASWTTKYALGGITIIRDSAYADVMNERGLAINLLYLPDFAKYQTYDPDQANISMSPTDLMAYLASQFATVAEVKTGLKKIRVVPVVEPALGIPAPVHYAITDASGAEIVVEYLDGKLNIYETTIGVMTNSPGYDWHLTNLRNYVNLRQTDVPPIKVNDLKLTQIGVGSGLIGLPGDYTPPSRFVRAAAWREMARKTQGGFDTTREVFRILDNFNLPIEGAGDHVPKGFEPVKYGSTQYTMSFDIKNLMIYYHTDDNRTVRSIDMKKVNWDDLKGVQSMPLRTKDIPPVREVTPKF